MVKIYSVLQINNYIKNMFDNDFVLENVSVSGEVSNCKYHPTGHIYFTLKDKGGTISAVMFAGNRPKGLQFVLKDGMKVVVTGSISVYELAGKYQIYAKQIKEDGHGELYERFLQLKKELEEMGMFDAMYKKPIPKNIKKLGVVTASSGAAVHDIISVSRRRNPGIEIILYPAKVQGEGAASSVCAGIEALSKHNVDVIIVGRGGGSIEDLWAFNEEIVARTVFDCNIPIISAVGHETDFTIIDFVSDLRAPTPSAAAELAVSDVSEIYNKLNEYLSNMRFFMMNHIDKNRNLIDKYQQKLQFLSPQNSLNNKRIMLDELHDRINNGINTILNRYKSDFKVLCARLNGASPISKLESGYSYVVDNSGNNVNSTKALSEGEELKIYLKDGYTKTKVLEIFEREENNGN